MKNILEQRAAEAFFSLSEKKEAWLRQQMEARGLTPQQFIERFGLEVTPETITDGLSIRFVEHLRLVPREATDGK